MKTNGDVVDTQIAINRAFAGLLLLVIVCVGFAMASQIGFIQALASIFIIAATALFSAKLLYSRKIKRERTSAELHQFIHGSGIYRELGRKWGRLSCRYGQSIPSGNYARVIQYSFGSFNPEVSYGDNLEILEGNQIVPIVVALYAVGNGRGHIGVKMAPMKDVVSALMKGIDKVKWTTVRYTPDDEWFEKAANLSQFRLSDIFHSMDRRAAIQYLNEPEFGHEIQCLVVESNHQLLDEAPARDMAMLQRWCDRHLNIEDSFSWPSGDQLIPALAQHIPAIAKHHPGRLPMSLTVLLGEYCLECKQEEPLRQYCFYLAAAVGRTQKPDSQPQRKNSWLIKAVHHHEFLQGPLLPLVKTILNRYPPDVLDSYDEHYMKGFHYLYGVEAALERFPGSGRLFLCKDLGI